MPSLLEVCRQYVASRVLAGDYERTLLRTASRCPAMTAQAINAFLKLRLNEVSRTTVRNERAMLMILWRWAWEQNLTDAAPRGVAAIRAARQPIRAWSLCDCQRAVKLASERRGRRTQRGADLGAFLQCWLLLGYETGARWGDLWAMRDRHMEGSMLRFSQRKTGEPLYRNLSPACVTLVNEMLAQSTDGRILGWVCGKRRAMRIMKEFLKECGMAGSSKWLRRSAATHIEARQRGQAKAFLGHKTSGLAEKSYIDWTQIPSDVPTAPSLVSEAPLTGAASSFAPASPSATPS